MYTDESCISFETAAGVACCRCQVVNKGIFIRTNGRNWKESQISFVITRSSVVNQSAFNAAGKLKYNSTQILRASALTKVPVRGIRWSKSNTLQYIDVPLIYLTV